MRQADPIPQDNGDQATRLYRIFAFPTLVLIDRQGVIREVSLGDPGALGAQLEQALAPAPSKAP